MNYEVEPAGIRKISVQPGVKLENFQLRFWGTILGFYDYMTVDSSDFLGGPELFLWFFRSLWLVYHATGMSCLVRGSGGHGPVIFHSPHSCRNWEPDPWYCSMKPWPRSSRSCVTPTISLVISAQKGSQPRQNGGINNFLAISQARRTRYSYQHFPEEEGN